MKIGLYPRILLGSLTFLLFLLILLTWFMQHRQQQQLENWRGQWQEDEKVMLHGNDFLLQLNYWVLHVPSLNAGDQALRYKRTYDAYVAWRAVVGEHGNDDAKAAVSLIGQELTDLKTLVDKPRDSAKYREELAEMVNEINLDVYKAVLSNTRQQVGVVGDLKAQLVPLMAMIGFFALLMLVGGFVLLRFFEDRVLMEFARVRQQLPVSSAGELADLRPIEQVHELPRITQSVSQLSARVREAVDALNIVNSLGEGLLIVSPDGYIRWVNDSICTMLGYNESELIGRAVTDIYTKMKTPKVQGFFRRNEDAAEENLFKTKDGNIIPVRFSSSFLSDDQMDIQGFVCLAKDITKEREAQEELQKQSQWLSVTLASIGDAVITTDTNGTISFMNTQAETLIGVPGDEAVDRPLEKVLRLIDERTQEPILLSGGGRTSESGHREALLLHSGDRWTFVEENASQIRTGEEQVLGWVVVIRDITERRLHAKELEREKEKALAAATAKSQFLANMSHEIRTPMNGIIGMSGLLLDTRLTREQRESAQIVRRSAEALLTLINDLLDFSKIESGKLELEIIEFDVRSCVEEIGDLLGRNAQEKGLEMVMMVSHNVPRRVMGDPGRLRQILLNLVNNAIKFTLQGEVFVKVYLRHERGGHYTLQFDVTDTGIGIPKDRVNRLFRPFSQVDASTTRKYGGTGLGLAICKQLTEAMGGQIWVNSEDGKGATFSFTAEFGRPAGAVQQHFLPSSDLKGLNILVVDTNATNRLILRDQLEHSGCVVEEADCAKQAFSVLAGAVDGRQSFDMVIIDFFLADDDGGRLAHEIKKQPKLAKLPILLLTSVPRRGDAAKMLEIGVSGYLTKPVKLSRLYDAIGTIMGLEKEGRGEGNELVTQHTLREISRNKHRVLVVEDNIVNQKVAVRLMEKLGYFCDVAANGKEAVEAVEQMPYDVILMDCQMPEMDGFEATREIRHREQTEGLGQHRAIIAMTANAMAGDRERCLEAGMDYYLSKPIQTAELVEALKQFVGD
ncbi:response regulator [Acanthopleuribacter pedis]|uniref:Sensory/regulatory protein RpfC n=1 Tax=Acanthopleuribacter pedis TaxID=442870 RepID=A0A8J7U7A8_9BACT|nr:response regulator [Acanthopleuribacter pedis]MBO1321201.1 response regulator [Acanthopleuribacter pedis]